MSCVNSEVFIFLSALAALSSKFSVSLNEMATTEKRKNPLHVGARNIHPFIGSVHPPSPPPPRRVYKPS